MRNWPSQVGLCALVAFMASQVSASECRPDCDCPNTVPKLLVAEDLPREIDQATLQRQHDVLSGMTLERIEYSPRGPVESLAGETGLFVPRDFGEREDCAPADDVLAVVAPLLLAGGTESLAMGRDKSALRNRRSRLLLQTIHGRPVISGLVGIEYDKTTLAITRLVANFAPDRGLLQEPKLMPRQAEQKLPDGWIHSPHRDPESTVEPPDTHLAYFAATMRQPFELVWAIPVSVGGMPEWAYVNAATGIVVGRVPSHVHDGVAIASRSCELRR